MNNTDSGRKNWFTKQEGCRLACRRCGCCHLKVVYECSGLGSWTERGRECRNCRVRITILGHL